MKTVTAIALNYRFYFIFKYFIDHAITVFLVFLTFIPLCPVHPLPPSFPQLTSCPWVIHINCLASPFPILFLTSPVYFVPTNMLLIPCTFSLILSPPPLQ